MPLLKLVLRGQVISEGDRLSVEILVGLLLVAIDHL